MSRIVSVWFPHWPIERLARMRPGSIPTTSPFALVETGPCGLIVANCNAAARKVGLGKGLSLADARAMFPKLLTAPAEAAADRESLMRLLRWLGRYGAARNRDGADGAWIDVTGVPHLFGGEAALAADLIARLEAQGITTCVGLADTLGAAHALARFAASPQRASMMADPGASRAALANLPVAALRLAPAHARLLERLGLRSIGALYDIPRAALERRFRDLSTRSGGVGGRAAAASVLLRLDQALGLVGEPRASQEEPPEAEVRRPFAEPMISSEGIAGALAHLARELCLKLEAQAFGGRRFVLRLYRVDATTAEVALGTSLPCRDAHHLCRVFADKLADIDAGFGIDAMALAAARLEPLSASQDALEVWPGKGVGLEAGPLIDRLSSRLGPAAVCRLEDVASHIPEKAQRWRPALAFPGTGADAPTPSCRALRPALLFEPPEPVAVIAEIPEGAPVRLVWRRRPRRIVKSEGPERIAPEWWHALGVMSNGNGVPPRTRDYYRLEDAEGTRYWVFREGLYGDDVTGEPRWKLQGIFA